MTFRIAKSPHSGKNVWFGDQEDVADGYAYVRDATEEEVILMKELLRRDAKRQSIERIDKKIDAILNPDWGKR